MENAGGKGAHRVLLGVSGMVRCKVDTPFAILFLLSSSASW